MAVSSDRSAIALKAIAGPAATPATALINRLTLPHHRPGGRSPAAMARRLSTARAAMAARVRRPALAMWGVTTTFARAVEGVAASSGSPSKTSRPAAMRPARSASASARSTRTGPRDVLTRTAPGFSAKAARPDHPAGSAARAT